MNDQFPPMPYEWNGHSMVPLYPKRAEKYFKPGQRYALGHFEDRSTKSHDHEFAFVREAWNSLPEHLAERFQSPEALRKWALIRAGFSNSHSMVCPSKAVAERLAGFLRPIDEFAVVIVQGTTVTRYTAMSQSKRAMGAQQFYKSKEAIIEIISRMIDVAPDDLRKVQAAA